MRPIEAILSGGIILSLLCLIFQLPSSLQWLCYVVPLTLLIAGMQILVEGARWQMVPAYSLSIIFCIAWFIQAILRHDWHLSGTLALISSVLSIVVVLMAVFLPIAIPVFRFPQPKGPYAIGTLTYHWVDESRSELFTSGTADHREIIAQIWYPAQVGAKGTIAPYIQDSEVMRRLTNLFHLPSFALDHLAYVTTHALKSVPINTEQSNYAVLIYMSGLDGFRTVSTFQIEALVSQGYIVVGLDQPGATAAVRLLDGREILGWKRDEIQPLINQSIDPQLNAPTLNGELLPNGIIPYFAQDAVFVLNQLAQLNADDPEGILTNHLDLEHVGVLGVSLGGINTAQACFNDARFRACLIMDAVIPREVVAGGLRQPTMIITRDADTMRLERERAGGWTEYDIEQHQTTMRATYEGLAEDGYYLQIPGIFHLNFTDVPYFSPLLSMVGMTSTMDRQRAFDTINAYSIAFFDKHLKGQSPALLQSADSPFSEVNFEMRHN